jgi:hypothetical protein
VKYLLTVAALFVLIVLAVLALSFWSRPASIAVTVIDYSRTADGYHATLSISNTGARPVELSTADIAFYASNGQGYVGDNPYILSIAPHGSEPARLSGKLPVGAEIVAARVHAAPAPPIVVEVSR